MSLTTQFAIASPVDPHVVFVAAREIIGIPAEQSFTVTEDRFGDEQILSIPGGFDSALIVWHHHGLPVTLDDDSRDPPVAFVRVALDTQFEENVDTLALHGRLTAELGAWCDGRGLEWWTSDEGGGWCRMTPAYARR